MLEQLWSEISSSRSLRHAKWGTAGTRTIPPKPKMVCATMRNRKRPWALLAFEAVNKTPPARQTQHWTQTHDILFGQLEACSHKQWRSDSVAQALRVSPLLLAEPRTRPFLAGKNSPFFQSFCPLFAASYWQQCYGGKLELPLMHPYKNHADRFSSCKKLPISMMEAVVIEPAFLPMRSTVKPTPTIPKNNPATWE